MSSAQGAAVSSFGAQTSESGHTPSIKKDSPKCDSFDQSSFGAQKPLYSNDGSNNAEASREKRQSLGAASGLSGIFNKLTFGIWGQQQQEEEQKQNEKAAGSQEDAESPSMIPEEYKNENVGVPD